MTLSRLGLFVVATLLLNAPGVAKDKLDQGAAPVDTPVEAEPAQPTALVTELIDLYYPETLKTIEASFPEINAALPRQIEQLSYRFFTREDMQHGLLDLMRKHLMSVMDRVRGADDASHAALLKQMRDLIAELLADEGEVPCSIALGERLDSVLRSGMGERHAAAIDALANLYFTVAASATEPAAPAASTSPDVLFKYMGEQGIPQGYVHAMQYSDFASGLVCIAYVRGLDALIGMPGPEGEAIRTDFAASLANF